LLTPSRLLKNAVLRPNFRMFAMVTKGQRGDQRRRRRKIDYLFVSYFTLQKDSSRCAGCRAHRDQSQNPLGACMLSRYPLRESQKSGGVRIASLIPPTALVDVAELAHAMPTWSAHETGWRRRSAVSTTSARTISTGTRGVGAGAAQTARHRDGVGYGLHRAVRADSHGQLAPRRDDGRTAR
jgi:hypothetical protein